VAIFGRLELGIIVMEVGIGGRLDATNAMPGEVPIHVPLRPAST